MTAQNTPPKEQNKEEELRDRIAALLHKANNKGLVDDGDIIDEIELAVALFQAHTNRLLIQERLSELQNITEYTDEMVDQPLIYYVANRIAELSSLTEGKE